MRVSSDLLTVFLRVGWLFAVSTSARRLDGAHAVVISGAERVNALLLAHLAG